MCVGVSVCVSVCRGVWVCGCVWFVCCGVVCVGIEFDRQGKREGAIIKTAHAIVLRLTVTLRAQQHM